MRHGSKFIFMLSHLKYIDQNHRVGDVAIQLLLLGHVRQIDQSPGYNAWAAIEEKLEVKPLANAWIELNAHHVVVKDIPGELAVQITREVVCYYSNSKRCADTKRFCCTSMLLLL